jgi:N-acetylneuraminic acid mutarotase
MRKDGRVRHIERLDPRASPSAIVSTFEVAAPFAAKNRQGTFLRGNVLTLFGGNRSLQQHDFGPDDFQSEAWSLDLATLAWNQRAAFPEGRQTIATSLAADGSVGFAVGGFGYARGGGKARDAGYRYAFAGDAWERAEGVDLPTPRTQFGLVQGAGKLWVLGGLDFDPSRGEDAQFHHPSEVLSLDLSDADARFVDSGAKLTSPRRAFASASLDDKVYLVGGMREEFDTVDECEVFDCATKTFAPMAAPRRTRISAEMVALGGKLYLCGGSSHGEGNKLVPDRSIECYDPATNAWSVLVEDMPAMRHARAFALRDRILIVSSHVDGPPTTRVVLVAP